MRRAFAAMIVVFAITAACADQGPALAGGACTPPIAVTVTPGATFSWTPAPDFSWDSSCRIASLEVAVQSTGAIVWNAFSPNQNLIAAPVRYAVTPDGAAMTANRIDGLVPGTTYQVRIRRLDATGTLRIFGTATFVP